MAISRSTSGLLLAMAMAMAVAAGCNRAPETLTPEAAKAKGDALLREMSKNLSALQTFAYSVDEVRTGGDGKETQRISRRTIVRRPSALTFTTTGADRDGQAWYDGKQITFISNRAKVWARGPMPGTLDEALDFLAAEYDVRMPAADLLYSNPYDALMTSDTTGGWVDVQQIGGRTCDHLAYQQPAVDWEIWLNETTRLPCQARIIYKNEPGQPATTMTPKEFEESPAISDDTFVAKIPDGYQRIRIMRRATVEDPNVEAAPAAPTKKP